MYLVDTNILSATAPTKSIPAMPLVEWLDRNSAMLFLSAITVAEIEQGIAKSRRTGAHRKAERLVAWLDTVLHLYGDRVVPIDLAVARRIGVISDLARARGYAPDLADVAIAATAQHYRWIVLTRNLKHFEPLGGPAVDPFVNLPAEHC